MFGYVKVNKEEMLVKDYALYRALYCGLCREIRKNVSFFIPFSLSYDFVFMAIVRDMLEDGGQAKIVHGRCPYNPFKKKDFVLSNGIKYTARASLILIEQNLYDKIKDGDHKFISPFLKIAHGCLKRRVDKHLSDPVSLKMTENVKSELAHFSELEKAKANSDELGRSFGNVLGYVLSAGLEGSKKRIAMSVGQAVGAWLYLADALDDAEKDYKKKSFNPLLEEYGTPENVFSQTRDIDITFSALARDAHLALSLVESKDFGRIADNILCEGLGLEAYNIMNHNRRKK